MKGNSVYFILTLFVAGFFTACQPTTQQGEQTGDTVAMDEGFGAEDQQPQARAVAQINPASGSSVTGTATFTLEDGQVRMVVELQNVPPGEHAIHLHEIGDCSAPDASSAGPHWNPSNEAHGHISNTDEFHYGDIGNLEAGNDSTVNFETTIDIWTIGGDATSNIVNKAVVVHAGPDDFTSQPAGDAGDRIACGVIQEEQVQ